MKQKYVEIWNFVCRFGESVMLDHYEEVVWPAFTDKQPQTSRSSTYVFHDVRHVNVGPAAAPSIAIAGRLIRSTVLHAEQRLIDNKLVPRNDRLKTDPSSFFVLLLDGHRLLFLREHRGAPNMKQFGSIAQRCIRATQEQHLRRRWKALKASGKRVTLKQLKEKMPAATVTIEPVFPEDDVAQFLKIFKEIRSLTVSVVPTNEEPNNNPLFEAVDNAKADLESQSGQATFRAGRGKTLNHDGAEKYIKGAADGTASFKVTGKDRSGDDLTRDNEALRLRVPVEYDPTESVEVLSANMADELKARERSRTIKRARSGDRYVDAIKVLIRKFLGAR